VAEPGKPPTEISRRDEIRVGPQRVITLAGGKLTGYRPTAQQTLARAAEETGLRLAPAPAEEPPLPGGDFDGDLDALGASVAREHALPADTAARLVRLYGSEAHDVARAGSAPLVPGAPVLASEVEHAVRRLGALHVEDVVYRRIRQALYGPSAREAGAVPVARSMAKLFSWDEARVRSEVESVRGRLAADLAFGRDGSAVEGAADGQGEET
jgi:glycerol-3-phosphate dehydrogenase